LDGLVRAVFTGRGVQLLEVAVSAKRKRRLSQQALRAAGATPGLFGRRYSPDGRAQLRQLTGEASRSRQIFDRSLSKRSEFTTDDERSEMTKEDLS
jgi:hypothetical protein